MQVSNGYASTTAVTRVGGFSVVPAVAADTQEMWRRLGPWVDADAATGYTLRMWLDGIGRMLQPVDDLVRDTSAGPGWSAALDVTRAPTAYLPWLGQFVGVKVDPGLSDAAQRANIVGEAGFARGTPAALISTAQRYLKGAKSVALTERDGDPYTVSIGLYASQLGSSTYNQVQTQYGTYAAAGAAASTYSIAQGPVGEVVTALRAAKPAGLILNVNVLTGLSYFTLSLNISLYSALATTYPTYAAMTQSTPG